MSNVIGFLEKMGQDSQMRYAVADDVKIALAETQIDPVAQAAILDGDQAGLVALLGARTNVICAVFPSKKEDEEEEEAPQKDDDEIVRSRGSLLRVASSG